MLQHRDMFIFKQKGKHIQPNFWHSEATAVGHELSSSGNITPTVVHIFDALQWTWNETMKMLFNSRMSVIIKGFC